MENFIFYTVLRVNLFLLVILLYLHQIKPPILKLIFEILNIAFIKPSFKSRNFNS